MSDETAKTDSPNLEFVQTDDLWYELQRRFDACVLIVEQSKSDKECWHDMRWHASNAGVLGLIEWGSMHIRRRINSLWDQPEDDGGHDP